VSKKEIRDASDPVASSSGDVARARSVLEIRPISHDRFRAFWALSDAGQTTHEAFNSGKAANQLILRVFFLDRESASTARSGDWCDFSIEKLRGRREFNLPKFAGKISAAIGTIDSAKRFSPLSHAGRINLPAIPDRGASNQTAPEKKLPGSPATSGRFAPRSGTPGPSNEAGASIEPQQELWSGRAPIELQAEFLLYGKLAPGFRLMMGREVVETSSDGMFTWRQSLRAFDQVWPLLRLALHPPAQATGPGVEFFKDVEPASRLLEINGALEVSGRLGDSEYTALLPEGLSVDDAGCFRFSRLLPEGAILLPGLSLVAD